MDIKPYRRMVNYYETDQMGIVHHSNYLRWFEEARINYLEQIGWDYFKKVMPLGIDMAVLTSQCEHKSMARFGDTVLIRVKITESSLSWLNIGYEIVDEESGQVRTIGSTSHCYYDNRKGRPVSLKNAVPELYILFNKLASNDANGK